MVVVHHPWVFAFGLLGNIISFLVFLAPLPTFWRIYKKKSTEGFQSLPYVCAIFSSMLWIYYAYVKTNAFLLITINGFGCVMETIYIAIFLTYAPKEAKMATCKLFVLLNLIGFSTIFLVCNYVAKDSIRVQFLGGICVAFAIVVFAAPLSVMRLVIRTKSVEFMPFPLSLTLTLSAVMWFMYGLLQKDLYIVLPNVGGFTFGVAQMVLFGIYRDHSKVKPTIDLEMKLSDKVSSDGPVTTENKGDVRIDGIGEANKDDEIDDGIDRDQRELHSRAPSPCGVDEIKKVGPNPAGAVPLVNCVV